MKFAFFFTLLLLLACHETPIPKPESNAHWWTESDRQFLIEELLRTTESLRKEISALSDSQWFFREEPNRWSIAEIVEHLEMQNQLHFREISVVSNAPQLLQYRSITEAQDQFFRNYATDTTKGQARWFLEPLGRFATKAAAEQAFFRARAKLTEWVQQTSVDLRKQFTFRTPVQGKKITTLKVGQVRDLHQLILTGIAHTDRHIAQIQKIKTHENYP